MAEIHKFYLPANKAHASVGSYDGGACLIKHVVPFTDNDSCSYRWQGVKKAEAQPGRSAYDAHPRTSCHVGQRSGGPFDPANTQSVTSSAGMAGAVIKTAVPTKKGLRDIVMVNNFTTAFAPYGNQVHHVLNASSLRKGIEDVSAVWGHIRRVIINGLLSEQYNLNHKDNNLILPTRDIDSKRTGLPKHYGSHPAYSAKILTSVKTAMEPYKKIANQMKKKQTHDTPEPQKLRDALIDISNTMYGSIVGVAAGNRAAGQATKINELPSAAYAGI